MIKRLVAFIALAIFSVSANAGGTSQYLAQQVLNYWFTAPASPAGKPATVYVALCTNTVTSTTACTEPSGNAYARVAVTANTTNWVLTANQIANGTVVTLDRKSTRLNSSHPSISYADFCLKKNKNTNE